MSTHDSYPASRETPDGEDAYIYALQQATAVVTQARNLDEALVTVLDACSTGLGLLHPCVALLDAHENRIVGRLVSSPHNDRSVRRIAETSNLAVDNLLGPRRSRRSLERRIPDDSSVQSDAVAFQQSMTENLVVQCFLERSRRTSTRYHDLVRPYLPAEDAEVVQRALGTGAFVLLPLVTAEHCFGVLIAAAPTGRSFFDSDMATLGLLAAQSALAAENARLQRELSDREQQVSFLLKATIDAQEEERERICLEIHDGVAQTLAPAFHYLQTLDSWPELPEALRSSVRKAGTLVRNAIREAREVIASLRPASLDTLGLVATLRYEMDELRDQANWRLEFDAEKVRFPKAVETALYRIIREAVNNVTKHAHATQVAVRIKQIEDRIVVEIHDNGLGFDFLAAELDVHRKGVGLPSMRKRTELLSGRFYLTSSPGRGTLVRVEVPLLVHTEQDPVSLP